jgi:TetR/AcrR family transcriptional repressor of nem operon
MRVSRKQAAQNRGRVVDTAAKLFRERGFNGVGVADLMKAAGMTHGAFYGQFESKEDLMTQSCARAYEGLLELWRDAAAHSPDDPLASVVASYMSASHRDKPGEGCVVAALGAEAAREGPALRRVMTEGIRTQIDMLSGMVSGRSKATKRQRAAVTFASMVGAMVLARVLDDEALSKGILRAVKIEASDSRGS